VKALAPQHPEWEDKEPFASLLKGNVKGAMADGMKSVVEIIMATHAGMTTAEFVSFRQPCVERAFARPMMDVRESLPQNKTYRP
jgi:hypothetical protein